MTKEGKNITIIFSLISIVLLLDNVTAIYPHRGYEGKPLVVRHSWVPSPQHAKAVATVCDPTSYKETCTKWLGNVQSDDPQVLVKSSIFVTYESLKIAHNVTKNMIATTRGKSAKSAIKYCKGEVLLGLTDLQPLVQQLTKVDDTSRYLTDNLYNVRWTLSQVFSYLGSCTDDISDEKSLLDRVMGGGIGDSKECTSNAMAIVVNAGTIFNNFGIKNDLPLDN